MVDTHLWNSIGISPSGSTIIACCKSINPNNDYYDIYYSINNTNTFNICNSGETNIPLSVNNISVIDISYVLFCTKENLYISNNNGTSFNSIFGSNNNPVIPNTNSYWTGVSISSDTGKYMVACIGGNTGGGVYISTDYGNNWRIALSENKNFTSISISETGKYIVASFSGNTIGGIYTSSDNGIMWSNNQTIPTNLNWTSICIKEKYSFAVVCDESGYIYTSTSNGNIWIDASLNLPITTNFKKICISDYGYAVALSNYNILVTANYGENWNIKSVNNISTIKDIGVSTNGILVVCDVSNIYTSSIYSVYNNPKIYSSIDVSFVTKGLLYNQVDFSGVLNTSLYVNFQNPYILPNSYNIVVQNSSDINDPSLNLPIAVSQTNNYYSTLVSGLKENIVYDIYLQSIYSNVISVINKQQYTKGSPINVSVDVDFITDVSMNISFINCPYIPNDYAIKILNQGNPNDILPIAILDKEYIQQHLIMYLGQPLIPYTIYGLSPDSKYELTITSNYSDDISYTSIPITDILTKSPPSNISYTLNTGNTVDITYSPPSYVIPSTITLFLFNVTDNRDYTQSSIYTKYTFTNLKVNETYNITLQSNYANNIKLRSSPITFTNIGKPTIVCSYRFDNNPEVQKYIITTNIYLASKPTYYIEFQYPNDYLLKYGIQSQTFDIPTNTTNFNLYNIDILGEYIITVYAIFDANTEISSDPFYLTVKQRPIIQFGYIDMSYTYINVPYTIYEYASPVPKYNLYFTNTLYSLIYDQSFNIPNILTDTPYSYTKKINIFAGTGAYNIYITDGIFYSDYINITVPEVVTVAIDYSKTIKNDNNRLTVFYTVLKIIPDSSYTLFVNGNISFPTVSFSSSTRNHFVTQLSVDVTIIGKMDYYIVNYFTDGSLYRTPSGTQNFDSKTNIDFGYIDVSYNYFVVPSIISTFAYRPRYNISISGNVFNDQLYELLINPSTVVSNNNSRFNVYANTGIYYIKLSDGVTNYIPDPSFIILPTPSNTLSDISYSFITSTKNNTNSNMLSISYFILNTFDPSYTLYLKNNNYNDLSFSISSYTKYTPTNFVPTTKKFIELTNTISRSGNYSFYIKHDYTGVQNNNKTRITYFSPSTNIVIDISNIVVLNYVSSSLTNDIKIQSDITTFDIIPLTYKIYLQSISFPTDLSYSYNITIPTSTNYTSNYMITNTTDFSNIYVNTGNYIYYIIDSNGRKYNTDAYKLTLTSQSNTFDFIGNLSVNSFSTYNANNNGKISTNYIINFESYKPTYTIFATNTTIPSVTDCSYFTSVYMDNSSTIIKRSTNINYLIDVSNIYRTGIYSVYLQNNYNGTSRTSSNYKEITSTKQIYLYLPNNVSFETITTKDISSVNIPFTITAYDISDVIYTVEIANNSFDISYSQSFTLANNNKYYTANISNNTIYFRNLFANSAIVTGTSNYSYKVYNNNGVAYNSGSTFTLPTISTTFSLRDVTPNINTSANDYFGIITTRYDISYITYRSTYKVVAIHNQLNDCSFTNSIAGTQSYPAISNPNTLSIQNIYRSGTYTVYLQNIYNTHTSSEYSSVTQTLKNYYDSLIRTETTSSKTVTFYLDNTIVYNSVSSDCSSITIPLKVTSHDLSFVTYTIYLQNEVTKNHETNDISYNQTFIVLNNNRNYSEATIYTSTFLFRNLYANSGKYNYYVYGNNGNNQYSGGNITLPSITTITLRDLSSTMFSIYSPTNIGKIIARYDISYVSYKPNYKLLLTHRANSACSYYTYVDSANIPSKNSDIQNSYDVSFSQIYRTGIYSVYIENEYVKTGSTYIDNTGTIDISVNLPNDISYSSVSYDISSINLQIINKCYDISNVYTVTIQNTSITTDISYNNAFSVPDNNVYTAPITTTKSFVFTNLFINTGNYYYYVTDWYGNRHPSTNSASNQISLPTKTNTLTLIDVSSTIFNTYSITNNGSITVKYDISYISYKPTHTLQVVSSTFTDCSYIYSISGSGSIIPSDYSNIIKNSYGLSISNIFRTSIYHVYLKNNYNNGLNSEQYTRDISVSLPNDVSYQLVTADTTSIAIKFEITSFDISATDYTLYIKNEGSVDISANKKFTIPYSSNYSSKNTLSVQDFSFQNLYANSGKYYYYFTNSNGINYPSITTSNYISLISLGKTIELTGLTSTMFSVYSATNVGGITGSYKIIVKSNNPTYTLFATHKALNDCSYSAAITPLNVNENTQYYLSISPIYRTGIYSVKLQNKYIGGITPEYSDSIDISVNLPNNVSFQTVNSTVNTITIQYTITSFDISNVVYTAYVKNTQFDLSANAAYTLVNGTNYGAETTYNNGTFTFSNLLANTGNYYYYFINSNGIRYPTTDSTNITSLSTATNTIALDSVSSTNTDVSGSITATYSISYFTYNPTYILIATNTSIGTTDCSYVGSITDTNIPTTTGSYSNLSVSNIKRSGNYNVVLKNIYNDGSIETASATKNILVNIPNVVSTSGVTSDISSITIPVTITSYDISNVTYTVNIKDISFDSLQSSQTYTLNNNTADYTKANSYTGTFIFKDLFANTGNYKYYITTNGVSYPENTISLKTATNTITLNTVSSTNSDVSGSITANYSILYLTYSSTYKLIATNNTIGTVTDCSYIVNITNVPTTYPYTIPTAYSLSISNIKRSGIYSVVLQNTYNGTGNIEYSTTKNILVNIPNDVSFGVGVTSDISSITIPFKITSYDISSVVYTLRIQDVSFADLSANSPDYTVTNSNNDYTIANTYSNSFTFTNLLANTGKYYYYMTNKTTGVKYPATNGVENTISLTPVANTIRLKSLSATTDTSGSITAKYDISYVSYAPKYKITAQHTHISATDCSYTNSTTTGLPSSYTNRINPYSIDISNIYRSGTYRVYLQNISGSIEQTSTLDISVNILNDVSFIKVTDTSYSIDISFQITTYDISLVDYKLYIQNATTTEASANQTYPIYPSRDYTRATTTNIYHSLFTGLTVSGNYNYYMIDGCNNRYNGSSIYLTGNGL